MTADTILLLALAVVWWVPTFVALADLQRRTGLPRPLVWRWTATLCVPIVGALLYFRRGRPALDAARPARPARPGGTSRSGVRGAAPRDGGPRDGARRDSARHDNTRRDRTRGDHRRGGRAGSGPGGRR